MIIPYDKKWYKIFENFRIQALHEGNDSLVASKLDPQNFNGQLLLCFYLGSLVSISACEASHYTGDPTVSARICRYHVLKKVRNQFLYCGFQMMREHCIWADEKGFEVVYFTQNIENKPLNSLYQKKRKYALGANNEWFNDNYFQSFEIQKDKLFQVSSRSTLLQFIYVRKKNPSYVWQPLLGVVPMPDGYLENHP